MVEQAELEDITFMFSYFEEEYILLDSSRCKLMTCLTSTFDTADTKSRDVLSQHCQTKNQFSRPLEVVYA